MSKRLQELVARYESWRNGGGDSLYFDTDEIIEIVEHYEEDYDFVHALEVIEFGLTLHPDNHILRLKQARFLLIFNRVEEARAIAATLDKGVESTLIHAELQYYDNHPEEGHRLLLSLLNRKEVWEDECFDAMDIYINYDDFEGLETFVAQAKNSLPDTRRLQREMAIAYEMKEDYTSAVATYNHLLDRDPYSFIDWFALAKVEALRQHYDRALEACDFALAIQEDDESVLLFKGYCYYDSGQYAQAVEQFAETLEFTEHNGVVYELIGECYVKLEQPRQALGFFNQALTLDPDNPNLHYQMATCHYDLGDSPQAAISLKETLRINEMDYEAHAFLGEILLEQGNYEEAYSHLKRAQEMNPDDTETMRFLCDACIQLDLFDKAIPILEVILLDSPYDLNARFNLTAAYAHQGNIERAEELIAMIDNQLQDASQLTDEEKQQWSKAQGLLESLKRLLMDELGEKD